MANKADRKNHAKVRFERIKRLRKYNAPLLIIKNEQIAMVCNRRGLKPSGNAYADSLREKYFP